jgi:hypothetical protein
MFPKADQDRQNRKKWARRKRRRFSTGLVKDATIEVIFRPLTDYFAGTYVDSDGIPAKPPAPPGDLRKLIANLEPEYLTLAAVGPVIDSIYGGQDLQFNETALCEKTGEALRARLVLKELLANSPDDDARHDLESHFLERTKAAPKPALDY